MKSKKQVRNTRLKGLQSPNVGISIILFLIFLFGLSSIIYTDSYKRTLEEQRKLTYGSWHIAVYDTDEEVYRSLKNHATVKSAGYMKLCGYVLNQTPDGETNILGAAGYAEDSLIETGNIKLLDGRFPSAENEIAIEASALNRMGYSYELGQQIAITISHEDDNGENISRTHIFKLCGVVKNYSSFWKSDGHWLASFFVYPKFFDEWQNTELYTFSEIEPEFAADVDSLSTLCLNQGYFTKNEFTYLQYSEQNEPALNSMLQQTVIMLSGLLFVLILMNSDIRQRYNSFIMMRILGATKPQIIQTFFREKAKVVFVSSGLGILSGLVLPYPVFLLISHVFTGPVACYFDALHILRMIMILYGGLAISLVLGLIALFRIPLRGAPGQQAVFKKPRKHRKKLRINNLFSVFNTADLRQRLFSISLTFIAAVFIYILSYQTWDSYSIYSQYQSNYPEDYSFGILASNNPPMATMSEESLEQVKLAYGVKEVQTVSVSDYYGLSFTSAYDTQYAEVVHEYLLEDVKELPDTPVSGSFIGVSDNLLPIYVNEIDSGFLDEGLAENEIILYIPNYYKQKDGSLLVQEDSKIAMPGTKLIFEDQIAVGDFVRVNVNGDMKDLKIAGIIRSFDKKTPFSYNPMRPYSLICSLDAYRQMLGSCNYAYVLVYNDTTTIPYQTDVELSKIQTGLYFNNNREVRSEQSQNLLLQLILSLVLSTSVLLVTTIIRFGIYSLHEKQKAERYQLLHKLGLSKLTMLKNMVQNAFFNSLIGCGIAAFVLFASLFVQEGRELLTYADYIKPDTSRFLLDIFVRYIHLMEWQFIVILFAGMLFLNFLILFIPDCRHIT
ncbi:ABC transporter permease [Parasporobacterium paucivorans]|uniref:FtsX-like permease family protein n=1 Tax=Parasporobacterium paucivorans DSM 15970 TaxID=1122934 RepID=A0A1M6KQ14_9FIRM|nr:ABC transporter permease [Parasporobacterium paucivorans]SHJ61030.1 FtsX-like permease family protein [Parasporobacterium paucivorans DSM 15970]